MPGSAIALYRCILLINTIVEPIHSLFRIRLLQKCFALCHAMHPVIESSSVACLHTNTFRHNLDNLWRAEIFYTWPDFAECYGNLNTSVKHKICRLTLVWQTIWKHQWVAVIALNCGHPMFVVLMRLTFLHKATLFLAWVLVLGATMRNVPPNGRSSIVVIY